MSADEQRAHIVEQHDTPYGTLVLRRSDGPDGRDFEIISDGMFLMDTRNGESERLLVSAALDAAERPRRVLIGGLGVGFSLAAALADPRVERVTVVELHPVVVEWNRRFLNSPLDDPKVQVIEADLAGWLTNLPTGIRFDAVCLDVDNGPDWLTLPGNAALHAADGIARMARLLTDTGVLAFWSAAAAPQLEARLGEHFTTVWARSVPVPRGEPDVIVFARDARRKPPR